jgi:hypothetical protein
MADEEIDRGGFLAVADQCASGGQQTVVANPGSRDFAFVLPSDSFGTNARNYMNRRPSTIAVTACRSLDSILRAICYPNAAAQRLARHITNPINNVIIVSHAGATGALFCKLNDRSGENQIFLDQLCPYVNDLSARPEVDDSIVRDAASTNIYIRGCNVGQEPQFLRFIKQIFGGSVTVTAPLHEDRFEYFRDGGTIYRFEFMRKCFKVARKVQASDKSDLVRLFQGLNATDIHGTAITQAQWNSWIPSNIHPSPQNNEVLNNYPCTITFHQRATVERFYRYRSRDFYQYDITWGGPGPIPSGHSDRVQMVRDALASERTMASDYPSSSCRFPMYRRWGFSSVTDFVNGLRWTFTVSRNVLTCTGGLYEYEVRIPITDASNTLMVNAILATGNRQYISGCNNIVETDANLFASV